jgi:hypothetical protein
MAKAGVIFAGRWTAYFCIGHRIHLSNYGLWHLAGRRSSILNILPF